MTETLSTDQLDDLERRIWEKKFAASLPSLPITKVDPDSFIGRAQAAQRGRAAESVRLGLEREAQLRAEQAAEAARRERERQEARSELARLAPRIEKREAERAKVNAEANALYAKASGLVTKDKRRHAALDALVADLQERAR